MRGLSDRGRRVLAECHRRVQEVKARLVADLGPIEHRQLADFLERCTRAGARATKR